MLSNKSDNPAIIDPKVADNFPIILLGFSLTLQLAKAKPKARLRIPCIWYI